MDRAGATSNTCLLFVHCRLINAEDKEYFMKMLHEMLRSRFEVREEYEELFVKRTFMFGG